MGFGFRALDLGYRHDAIRDANLKQKEGCDCKEAPCAPLGARVIDHDHFRRGSSNNPKDCHGFRVPGFGV